MIRLLKVTVVYTQQETNIPTDFITQSYMKVRKSIRLKIKHYLKIVISQTKDSDNKLLIIILWKLVLKILKKFEVIAQKNVIRF